MKNRSRWALCLLVSTILGTITLAVDNDAVLIRDVLLIDRAGENDDVVVSILIENKKLKVVTKDEVPAT